MGVFDVVVNTPAVASVGAGSAVTDLDSPDVSRGILTYSITGGNVDGYFGIDAATGEIKLVNGGLDYEQTQMETLIVKVSDNFAANPGELIMSVVINVIDIVGDDSQGGGIQDEWALENLGVSDASASGDADGDGIINLFEFWADTDPVDPRSFGPLVFSYEVSDVAGSESYSFEWIVRSDLVIGQDYIIQGCDDMDFDILDLNTDYTFSSLDLVANPGGPGMTRVRIKVLSTAKRYFLRLSTLP